MEIKYYAQSSRRLRQKLTECASHTTERTGHVLGGSQRDGLSCKCNSVKET